MKLKEKENEIKRTWEYSSNPRLEGLLQASKYLKWKNINSDKIVR